MENDQFFQGLIHLNFWNVTHFLVFPHSYQDKHVQWTLSNLYCVLLWLKDVMLAAKILPYSTIQKQPNCILSQNQRRNWWDIHSMIFFHSIMVDIISLTFDLIIQSIHFYIIWLKIVKLILLASKKNVANNDH